MTKKEKEQMEKYLIETLKAPVSDGSSFSKKYGAIYPPEGPCIEISGEAYEFLYPFFDGCYKITHTRLNGAESSIDGNLLGTIHKICSRETDKTLEVCMSFYEIEQYVIFRCFAKQCLYHLRLGWYNRLKLSRFREECTRSVQKVPLTDFFGGKS